MSALTAEKLSLQEELNVVAELIQKCIATNARVAQDQEEYQKKYESLVARFDAAKARLAEVEMAITEKQARRETTEMFLNALKARDEFLTEFDEPLWYSLVDHVTVFSKDNVRFTMKDGTEITVGLN